MAFLIDPISIMSLVAAGIKGISGAVQGIKGKASQRDLWKSRPLLGVTEGEKKNDALYNQMASVTSLPGQQQYLDKLGQATSEGISDINKTAVSSVGATQGAIDLTGKKIQAVQDLASQFADFKAQRQSALANWNKEKIGLEQERFGINELQPWDIKMNEAQSSKQAGFQNFGNAVDTGLSTLQNLQGTKDYLKILEKLYPNLGK